MPSPVGHSLAGLCGYMVARNRVDARVRGWLLLGAVILANLADLDFLPGLLAGHLPAYHHRATHSLLATALVGLALGGLARWRGLNGVSWGLWGPGVYLSHIVLDMLVDDPVPPFGIQLLWPFSSTYYIAPITPFAWFDYFDPALPMIWTLLTVHNLGAILTEIVLMTPLVALSWYMGKNSRRGFREA